MLKKVHFIGSGYESIKHIVVEAETDGKAIEKAVEMYKNNGWSFKYCEIEVDKCL